MAGYHVEYILAFISVIIHELSHTTAALALKKRVYTIKILPMGINVSIDEYSCSRQERIFIYICGPAINVFLAVCVFLYLVHGSGKRRYGILPDDRQCLSCSFQSIACLAV
jgi:hypothetical protein